MADREGIPEHHIDGAQPVADVGPNEAEDGVAGCEVRPGERDGAAGECQYRMADEFADAFPVEALATPIAEDHLPDHSVDPIYETHPFTYETVCCVEDDRHYVELWADEVTEYPYVAEGMR